MAHPVLASPVLLGTAHSERLDGLDALQKLLERNYLIQDFELNRVVQADQHTPWIHAATAVVGEIGLVSVQGPALTLAVEPTTPLCLLALPSMGWGRYQLDGHRIDNTVGATVAYLPPRAWRLTNSHTGGTGVQFTQDALLNRLTAFSPGLDLLRASARLSLPFAIETDRLPARHFYAQLLGALEMIDSGMRHGFGLPHPMLRLDDLILRCVAGLLCPQISQAAAEPEPSLAVGGLRRTVHALMEWMSAHLHEPICLNEIEQRSHYGRRAIQMGFRAEVGCGPMQWLRRQRLQMAHHQLSNPGPGCTVTSVAQACGYLNLASFSRDFRERFGITASALLGQSRRVQ